MPRYSLFRDRLFLASCIICIINRGLIKPNTSIEFFHQHLNDLLCFPIWIPVLVSLLVLLRLRPKGEPPHSYEILIPLLLWSWTFEAWLPTTSVLAGVTIADHRDIIWYAVGALVGTIYWRRWSFLKVSVSAT